MKRTSWIVISGMLWFSVGVWLLALGTNFIVQKALLQPHESLSVVARLAQLTGGRESGAFMWIMLALLVGFFKGRFMLAKTVYRVVFRLRQLPEPISIRSVYRLRDVALIGVMIGLGLCMKWFAVPLEIRGFVDVAVGSALINGAVLYFRSALQPTPL